MEKIKKISFKDYFAQLNDDQKKDIRNLFMIRYEMAYSTFFAKVAGNTWSVLEFEKLEEVFNQNFER